MADLRINRSRKRFVIAPSFFDLFAAVNEGGSTKVMSVGDQNEVRRDAVFGPTIVEVRLVVEAKLLVEIKLLVEVKMVSRSSSSRYFRC